MASILAAQGQPTPHLNLATNSPTSEPGPIPEINSTNYPDMNYYAFLYHPDDTNSAGPHYASTQPMPGPSRDRDISKYLQSLSPLSSLERVVESAWKKRGGELVFDRHAQIQEVNSNADSADLQALEFREESLPPDTTPPPPPRPHLASLAPSPLGPSTQNSPRHGEVYLGLPTVPNSPTISQNGSPWPPSRRRTETNVSDSISLLGNTPTEPRPVLDHATATSRLADVLDQPHRRALSPYRRTGKHSRQNSVPSSGRYPLPSGAPRPKRGGSLLSRTTTPAAWNISPMPTPDVSFAPPAATSSLPGRPEGHTPSASIPRTEAGPSQAQPQPQPTPQRQPSSPQNISPQRTSTPRPPSGLSTQRPSPPPPSSPGPSRHQPPPAQNMTPSAPLPLPQRQSTPPSPLSHRQLHTPSRPQQSVPPQPHQTQQSFQPFPDPQMPAPNPYHSQFTSGPTGYPDVDPAPATSFHGQHTHLTPQLLQFPLYHAPPGIDHPRNANAAWQGPASPTDPGSQPNPQYAGYGSPGSIPWPLRTFQDLPQPGRSGSNHTPYTWPAMPRSEGKSPRAYTPFAPFPRQPPQFPAPPQHYPMTPEGNNQGPAPFPEPPQHPSPTPVQQQSQHRPSPRRQPGSSHADMGPQNVKGKQREAFAPSLGVPQFQSTPPPYQHRNLPPRWATPPEDILGLIETNMRHLKFALGDIDGLTAYFGKADQVHDVNPHALMTGRVRAALHTLTDVLTRQRSLRPEQLQLGTQRWHEKCTDRLGSLWRTIHSFSRFVHAISGREPTISTLTKALAKLSDFESKLSNLASKFNSLLNRLRVRQLYSDLSRAHIEANEQLRNARSKRDLPGWEEGKIYRAELRRKYIDFRNCLARGRRASLNS